MFEGLRSFRPALILLCLVQCSLAGGRHGTTRIDQAISGFYEKLLDQDVRWIITPEEKAAFLRLRDGEERDNFIEQFWDRRDPTPETLQNEFKETHYARMLYAREHFSTDVPGWGTARGRVYVMYGAPDRIEYRSEPLGLGTDKVPRLLPCAIGGPIVARGYISWHYDHVVGRDKPFDVSFANICGNPADVAVVNKTDAEWLSGLPVPVFKEMCEGQAVSVPGMPGLRLIKCLGRPPQVLFKDLEEVVSHKVQFTVLPFELHSNVKPITDITALVMVTLMFKNADICGKVQKGNAGTNVRIFGRITNQAGRIAHSFEGTILESSCDHSVETKYVKSVPLFVGKYQLAVAVTDADRIGSSFVTLAAVDAGKAER